ncbi:MAG: helix-turn-helix domain-containing protein, partial [Candidatus Eremiobacteraeota bacterium]|nr:helix-turn-helix domain-containing protein [Candidatus Eremiobacteraeota bacterium]
MNATQVRSFGELLRQYRVAAGLTQETLAERAHMSAVAVGALERGTRQRPYRATIELLADALSLSAEDRLELERAAQRGARAVSAHVVQATINLPVHLSSFVGREQDLTKLGEMLATQRLVTLVGAGGVGKTRLAIRAAEHFVAANATDDALEGVWFVDVSSVGNAQMTMTAIASSAGLGDCRTLDALIRYLKPRRFLLILDNCEHLVEAVAQLALELLRHCPSAQIVVTSRQALGLDGERIYRVPPLSVPMADAGAELSPSDALKFGSVRLFADRAEAADSRFELTVTAVPAVSQICRRLDGIALAIELAAAYTNAFPPAAIAQRLDEHFLLFARGMRSPSRHKTMQTVFDWSYDLLDQNERKVFRWLSIFAGGFTLDLATLLLAGEIEEPAIIETLAALVDKSLVQYDPFVEPSRYKMLEPARQYAREKLRDNGEQNAAAGAHASALLALAERFDSSQELTPDHVWGAYVERERDNFRSALEWTLG